MADRSAEFRLYVGRLQRRARVDKVVADVVQGLFFGLLPALALALVAGTFTLPMPAPAAVAGCAGAGVVFGVVRALVSRQDRRRLLLRADEALNGRELISTAAELSGKPGGAFQEAIIEDASTLLAGAAPRMVLGPVRLPLAPFAAVAAALIAALLLFPVDLRALLAPRWPGTPDLAQIGEDLRSRGKKLAEEARTQDLGRMLELSEELAQLGKDLAARRISPDDALDRMSELESGLAQEYQLRLTPMQPASPQGGVESGPGQAGDSSASGAHPGADSASSPDGKSLQDLKDALNGLRQAERQLDSTGRGSREQAQVPTRPGRPRGQGTQQGQSGPDLPGAGPGQPGQAGDTNGAAPEQGSGGSESPGEPGGRGIGALPAPEKRGPASSIEEPGRGPALQAQGSQAEGDSTQLLARALPKWSGSRLPEATVILQYAQAAESALGHDEVPLSLRQAVKEYFTAIGISR